MNSEKKVPKYINKTAVNHTNLRIAIVGAGILGRLLAYGFALRGCRVEVYDKGALENPSAAAHVAAAMLAPLAESVSTEPNVVAMGYYSLARWPSLLAELDHPVFFQQTGSCMVWHPQDQSSATHFIQQLHRVTTQNTALPKPQLLDKQALAALEPQLSQSFEAAYFLPSEGQLDNRELLHALHQQCLQLGVTFHWQHPIHLADFPLGKVDHLIDCRGLGSQKDLPTLRGVRGEVLRLFAPEVKITRPIRLIHPKYPLYIAPKRDHLYVIGATEIESEDASPLSVRSSLELLSAAYTVHSGFAEARIIESGAQCRPSFKNNLPQIFQPHAKITQVNGLYRHGFLIAPAIVDGVLALILEQDHSLVNQFLLAHNLTTHENIC